MQPRFDAAQGGACAETKRIISPCQQTILDADMTPADLVAALTQLTFPNDNPRTIGIDRAVRDFLVTALRRK